MKITNQVLTLWVVASTVVEAFVPSSTTRPAVGGTPVMVSWSTKAPAGTITPVRPALSFQPQQRRRPATTSLHMAAEDFNEAKYTETAWSSVSSLTKVADFYQASTVEAPFLLDVMLNPSKHNAGESADAAQKVVEKALGKAGVNIKELRSELETFLAKQARLSDYSSKSMGYTLQKVLETARVGQSVLGVSATLHHTVVQSFGWLQKIVEESRDST